jgi:hypothetical protein
VLLLIPIDWHRSWLPDLFETIFTTGYHVTSKKTSQTSCKRYTKAISFQKPEKGKCIGTRQMQRGQHFLVARSVWDNIYYWAV